MTFVREDGEGSKGQLRATCRVEGKNLAKFRDTCSVRADGLCIGSPRLVGGRKAGK